MNALPGGQGGLNAFKAGLATGGASQAGAPVTGQGPFSPPATRQTPPQVSVNLPSGAQAAMFQPGSTIHGRVAGQQPNGQFMLRLGDLMMKADSRVPLKVGDAVQFQVQGENKGQVHLKLVSTPFEKMSMNDLGQALTNMKVPMDEKTMSLAKTMVEQKIPLTKENLAELKTALAQTAPKGEAANAAPLPNRVAATNFLQSNNIPVTPQSVGALSNFLASNPQVGQQMAALNTEFKKLNEVGNKVSKELNDMISQVQTGIGKLGVGDTPKTGAKKEPGGGMGGLKAMAQQAGMEKSGTHYGPGGFGGGEEWDFPAMIRRMRERALAEGVASEDLLALMEGLEQNIEAQRLINAATPESLMGYYYMQLGLKFEGFKHGEMWVQYTEDGNGRRHIDPEDTRLEFFVQTDEMGELHFVVDVRGGKVHIDLGTPSHEVRQFAARYLPALAERVRALGWTTGRFRSHFRPVSGKRELVEHTDFEDLERFNVHA